MYLLGTVGSVPRLAFTLHVSALSCTTLPSLASGYSLYFYCYTLCLPWCGARAGRAHKAQEAGLRLGDQM